MTTNDRITSHAFSQLDTSDNGSSRVSPSILRVLAVDPGITTGLAYRDDSGLVWTDESKGSEDVIAQMLKFEPAIVIVERFATSGRMSGYGLETIELVGRLTGAAQAVTAIAEQTTRNKGPIYGFTCRMVVQYPQYRKSMQDKAKLHSAPSLHGRRSHAGRHEADALAHLLAYQWHTEKRREDSWYK